LLVGISGLIDGWLAGGLEERPAALALLALGGALFLLGRRWSRRPAA
jgi:hypothetical protein